jgi:hypothetical protein
MIDIGTVLWNYKNREPRRMDLVSFTEDIVDVFGTEALFFGNHGVVIRFLKSSK